MLRSKILAGITRYWWLPLVTGLLCVGLGLWAIFSPSTSLPIMAMAFAIGLLVLGAFDAVWGISTAKHNPGWGWDICFAIIDIIAGIWMLTLSPAQMTLAFLYIIGIWLIFAAFNGMGQIFSVSMFNPVASILAGILLVFTLFLGFWLIFNPIGLSVTAWIWLGIGLVCYGTYRITVACRIKQLHNRLN